MRACKNKNNYDNSEDGYIVSEIINSIKSGRLKDASSMADQKSAIEEIVQKCMSEFAIRKDVSSDPDNYEQSVNELLDYLFGKIIKDDKGNDIATNGKIDDLLKKNKKEVAKDHLLYKNKSIRPAIRKMLMDDDNDRIRGIISDITRQTNMGNEQDGFVTIGQVSDFRMSDVSENLFGSTRSIEAMRQSDFSHTLMFKMMINPGGFKDQTVNITKYIIDNLYDVNKSIMQWQEEQYEILVNIVKSLNNNELPKGIAEKMYTERQGNVSLDESWINLMTVIYNWLMSDNNIQDHLRMEYFKYMSGQKTSDKYRAAIAFMNLMYFDDTLQEVMGKSIVINRKMEKPIEKNNDNQSCFKYSFGTKGGNIRPNWGQENRDAIKEASAFTKLLVQQIPIYDYKNKKHSFNYMSLKEFNGATTKLIVAIQQLASYGSIALDTDAKKKFVENAKSTSLEDTLMSAFEALFGNKYENNNEKLKDWLKQNCDFSDNDLNYLFSIYRTVFQPENYYIEDSQTGIKKLCRSWKTIEKDYWVQNGIDGNQRYGMYLTILAQIQSVTSARYLQTSYNDEEGVVTTIKDRYTPDRQVFDMIDSINDSVIANTNKKELLDKYKLTFDTKNKTVEIKLTLDDGTDFTITITGNDGDIMMTSGNQADKVEATKVSNLEKVLFHIHNNKAAELDLTSSKDRQKLMKGENLTTNEKKLKAILQFIEDLIHAGVSNGNDSLMKLGLALNTNNGQLEQIFLTAARALVATHIYNSFENAIADGKYSKRQLNQFLEDNWKSNDRKVYPFRKYPDATDRNDKMRYRYWQKHENYNYILKIVSRSKAQWIHNIAQAQALINGNLSKATTKNFDGDSIPNFTMTFLGAEFQRQVARIKAQNSAESASKDTTVLDMEYLLFMNGSNANAVSSPVINTDVMLQSGLRMQVKSMSKSELLVDSLLNKFIVPLTTNQNSNIIYVQPTVLSDKTKFITYGINLDSITESGQKIFEFGSNNFYNNIIYQWQQTLGKHYEQVWHYVIDDFDKLFRATDDTYAQTVNQNTSYEEKAKQIQSKLKKMTYKQLEKARMKYNDGKSDDQRIEIFEETHYRINDDNTLSLNELLYFYAHDYFKGNQFAQKLDDEMLVYLNQFLSYRISFTKDANDSNHLLAMFKKLKVNGDEWFIGNNMVMAIIRNSDKSVAKKVLYGELKREDLQQGQYIDYNPILKAHFYLNGLLSNNLRLSLTGSEIGHAPKGYKELINNMRAEVGSQFIGDTTMNVDNWSVMDLIQYIDTNQYSLEENKKNTLIQIARKYIDKISSGSNNTFFKRQVIIPATIRPYMNDQLNSISSTYKVAIIEDMTGIVFNPIGQENKTKVQDGAAWMNPFTSILENMSLQDNEVGFIKKPIMHFLNKRTGCATLLKYAVDTITNQNMRDSEGNDNGVKLYEVFRKMTDIRWNNTINLTTVPDWYKDNFNFQNLILDKIRKGNELYYADGNNFYKITNFGYDQQNKVYWTEELAVDDYGYAKNKATPVTKYHYFDNITGEHIKSKAILKGNYHTIDSLFELHKVMGGIYSVSLGEDGALQSQNGSINYSESSNYVVAQFMNSVATLKEEYKQKLDNDEDIELNQKTHNQPLKHMLIDVVCNHTAVKNGAGNINSVDRFFDDRPLDYMVIDTYLYGIQQDSDHTADEATLTEFTQVISALTAGNRDHRYVNQIYRMLGKSALSQAEDELNALKSYKDSSNQDKNDLYECIGRMIVNDVMLHKQVTHSTIESIIKVINRKFDLNVNHNDDRFKIPFSDPSISTRVISTITSILNKKSIKRKYSGLGTVMAPGYNMEMIYDLDDTTMLFGDILRRALNDNIKSTKTDINAKNRDIVQQYLQNKQNAIIQERADKVKKAKLDILNTKAQQLYFKNYDDCTQDEKKNVNNQTLAEVTAAVKYIENYAIDCINPTDNIYITYRVDGSKEIKVLHVSLDDINTYYDFKRTDANGNYYLNNFIAEYANIRDANTIKEWHVYKDVTRPRNLAPSQISWDYDSGNGVIRHMNIYDHPMVRQNFTDKKLTLQQRQQNTQQLYDNLANGHFELGNKYYTVLNLQNKAAELMVSQMYKTKFGIKNNDSLDLIRQQGEAYFDINVPELAASDSYDLVYTKANGNHDYISFKPLKQDLESENPLMYRKRRWRYIKDVKIEGVEGVINPKVYCKVYALDENGVRMFQVGRRIFVDDVTWDDKERCFKKNGKKLEHQGRYKRVNVDQQEKVVEYVEFISKYSVNENGKRYTLYYINKKNIQRTMDMRLYTQEELKNVEGKNDDEKKQNKFNEEVNQFISNLAMNIYNQSDYLGIQLNNKVSPQSHYILQNLIPRMIRNLNNNPELQEYLSYLNSLINNEKVKQYVTIKDKDYGEKKVFSEANYNQKENIVLNIQNLDKYYKAIRKKKYVSFQKSLTFTAARIPAQSMQSFMQMQCVAFIPSDTGVCYVSHWQTWLQGSDYDIDKAFLMGMEFSDSGIYQGWSNLFDYSTIETLRASENLAAPNFKVYEYNENGIDINDEINKVAKIENELTELRKDEDKNRDKINQKLVERMNAYVKLIDYLNDNVTKPIIENAKKKFNVKYDNTKVNKMIMNNVRKHEFTVITKQQEIASQKNFVSSHIQNVIQNIRNLNLAYTPIGIDEMTAASEISEKGQMTDKLSFLNPNTIVTMQIQNLEGKNDIGVAANGEKAAFMWHFYSQDILENPTTESLKHLKFSFETSRIVGRNNSNPQQFTVTCLPNINKSTIDGTKNSIQSQFLNGILSNDLTSDNIISQLITLSTDNAKLLLISRINAGTKLMKCYLFLATLGFKVNDIVNFMCSGAVNFIEDVTDSNRFNDTTLSIFNAIDIAKGDFSLIYAQDVNSQTKVTIENLASNMLFNKIGKDATERVKILQTGNVEQFLQVLESNDKKGKPLYENSDWQHAQYKVLQRVWAVYKLRQKYINQYELNGEQNFLADVDEFAHIYEGANEFSQLGKILSLNQGLETSKEDQYGFERSFKWIIGQRIQAITNKSNKSKYTKDLIDKCNKFNELDVKKFISDEKYRNEIINFYDQIKVVVNIFDLLWRLPQFRSVLQLEGFVLESDEALSLKSRIFRHVITELDKEGDDGKIRGSYMDDRYAARMLGNIDKLLIQKFILSQLTTFQIPHGAVKGIGLNYETVSLEQGMLSFNNLSDIMSFKKIMEEYIIPDLKEGKYYIIDANGAVQLIEEKDEIKNNPFITNLIRAYDKNTPYYKSNIDLSLIDSTAESAQAFTESMLALEKLNQKEYQIDEQGHTIADLFALYNLVVNHDKYGNDRLTKFFDIMMGNLSSIASKYLQWVGEADHNGQVNGDGNYDVQVDIDDLLQNSAGVEFGWKHNNPSYLKRQSDGTKSLYVRTSGKSKSYSSGKDTLPVLTSEKGKSDSKYIDREINMSQYNTLIGISTAEREKVISELEGTDEKQQINAIMQLLERATFILYKLC